LSCTSNEKLADPVKDLDTAAKRFNSEVRGLSGFVIHEAYAIDVRRTDSLVTPFLGTLEFQIEVSEDNDTYVYRVTCGYQEGKWVLKSFQECLDPLKVARYEVAHPCIDAEETSSESTPQKLRAIFVRSLRASEP